MTNTTALDLMLRLYITAESNKIALKQGQVPSRKKIAAFYQVVERTMHALIQKVIDDDHISEWEMEQRWNALIEELKQFHEAAKEVKH